MAYDGLAIVVNKENTWLNEITVAELKKMWEPAAQGKVTKWNQINSKWPAQEIHLFGAGTQSGTFDYFTEAIVGKAKECRGDYTASEDDNGPLLRDITTGSVMIAERWYGVGDYIIAEPFLNIQGVVEQVSLRSTKLRGLSGEVV